MAKINETNYPRRTQANYADTDMLIIQAAGGNTYTTRIEDMREDCQETMAPTVEAINDALAPAENGSTASQAYAVGEHFMRDGAFCTAIAAIASGASFTLNTNYVVGTIAEALESLNSNIAVQMISDLSTIKTANVSSCGGTLIKCNGIVTLNFYAMYTSEMVATSDIFTLPAEYRPASTVYGNGTIFASNGTFAGYVKVSSTGIVDCDTSTSGTTIQGTLIYKA